MVGVAVQLACTSKLPKLVNYLMSNLLFYKNKILRCDKYVLVDSEFTKNFMCTLLEIVYRKRARK